MRAVSFPRVVVAVACLAALPVAATAATPPRPASPADVLAAAPADAWRRPDPALTLLMELRGGGRVVIELAPAFAQKHVAQVTRLVHAGWYDGLAVGRLQDNYVAQWGDTDGTRPLPEGMSKTVVAEFSRPSLRGLSFTKLVDGDVYARVAGYAEGWPVAYDKPGGPAWLAHCYGMVGAGRDLDPDSGGAGELYAVIGHAPRHLDLNVTLLGRVLTGIEALSSLPRGTEALGFYRTPEQRAPIERVRMLAQLPEAERPLVEVLRTDTPTFRAWVDARRNRRDDFFLRSAGRVDLCNAMPPVRTVPR